ncbi:phosphoglycerate mutase-like protein [Physcomitrium patens]|uniref:Phosphoglycerate mutase-like protein n=1 Tax=Physcomitrium patens TaxID=3218 RepID=A9SQW8_PHYPA|nr:phosphoglycerate mutase-like protein [Physcomitrium patens]PNR36038.1 hypothetical protein PHYPA_021888 [Physcomitrium patens]|eukprot:XP_024400430.1 phosphoglycerate mutase-like protein [Physcomitrella patens]
MTKASGAYPLARCKVIYLVRHGQATHNKARLESPDDSVYKSEAYFDAPLTDLGWYQAQYLREHVTLTGAIKPQLVVTSPLSRCIQTAIGVFGSGKPIRSSEPTDTALMLTNVAGTHPSVSSKCCPKFMAVEWCREHLGIHPCDRRQDITTLQTQYPAVDFTDILSDQDIHWKPDTREQPQEVRYRARGFANWLLNQTEQKIAVVSHSGFIWEFTRLFGADLSRQVKEELQGGYANCEVRSVLLVDKVGIEQPFGKTDFAGCSAKYFPGQ